jgi:23S rRNA (uracil1939-C5)-methyltransferase
MFQKGEIVELEISGYAFGGRGISRIQTEEGSYVVFVDNAFPGQRVRAKIDVKRKRHAEGKLIDVIRRSADEKDLPFQEISGGPYIFVPIELQEKEKKESTLDVFSRIGGMPDIATKFDEFIASPIHFFYRNKMEYSFSTIEHDLGTGEEVDESFALGFKRRGTWWKVENLNRASGLFDEQWETMLFEIRAFLKATGLPAWHPPRKEGFFRHIVVRKSFDGDALLINLVTSSVGLDRFNVDAFSDFLLGKLGKRLAGFQHTINDNVADRAKIENGQWRLVYGEPVVIEKLLGLSFEISMESFFQTNPRSAEKLYAKALSYVFEEPVPEGSAVMDLFCGTGTIGQILSNQRPDIEVIGVDIVPEAIEDAVRNAHRNGIDKVKFFAADVGKFLKEHPEYLGKIATVILDPPRAGIAPKTLKKTIDLGAENIVYISCNPSTQARDADTLRSAGYELEKLSFVDQFPHTGHIESIAKFKKMSK